MTEPPVARTSTTSPESWQDAPERGPSWGIRLTAFIAGFLGRAPARFVVRVVAFYFTLFAPKVRRAANDFLRRLDRPTGFWPAYRQVLRLSHVTLDGWYFLSRKFHHFEIERTGHHYLAALKEEGRGAILLGAHFGSFYAMRGQASAEELPIHPLVYQVNAQRINSVIEAVDPTSELRLIQIEEESIDFMLKIRELVDRGGLVAILGDRVPKGSKYVEVDFLGGRARMPAGPYLLATTLKCPVYLTLGIYRHPSRYELFCEPLWERVVLDRKDRLASAQKYAQEYADRLAAYVRTAPDNWFNFYEYWERE
jgi:predicted LPLAT superfamily acyltransferase